MWFDVVRLNGESTRYFMGHIETHVDLFQVLKLVVIVIVV